MIQAAFTQRSSEEQADRWRELITLAQHCDTDSQPTAQQLATMFFSALGWLAFSDPACIEASCRASIEAGVPVLVVDRLKVQVPANRRRLEAFRSELEAGRLTPVEVPPLVAVEARPAPPPPPAPAAPEPAPPPPAAAPRPAPAPPPDGWITTGEVAQLLGLNKAHITTMPSRLPLTVEVHWRRHGRGLIWSPEAVEIIRNRPQRQRLTPEERKEQSRIRSQQHRQRLQEEREEQRNQESERELDKLLPILLANL